MPRKLIQAFGAAGLVIVCGISLLWRTTEGFRVYTTEGARRFAVSRVPQNIPRYPVQWNDGTLTSSLFLPGKVAVVDFIYTRCTTLCLALGGSMGQLEHLFKQVGYGQRIQLISLSLDPTYDTPNRLNDYLRRFSASSAWKAGRILQANEQQAILQAFGVVAIPDGLGGIEHNAALHVINAQGQLVGIFDTNDVEGVAHALANLLRNAGT